MTRIKAITVSFIALLLVVLFDMRPCCSLGHADGVQFTLVVPEDPPKIVIPSGTKLPGGIVESEAQASGGTIKGELFVDGTLTVQGPLVVDGQLLVGDKLGSPLGMATVTSKGDPDAEAPDTPTTKWGNTNVHGPLTVHGPIVVTGSIYFLGDISLGGTMGAYCHGRLIFLPRGSYPIAQRINFNCPQS